MPDWLTFLTVLAALTCGLLGGLFFTFSNFVMRALKGLSPANAVAAMQAINVTVLNPLFLGIFMGTAVLSLGLTLVGVSNRGASAAAWLIVASLLYLVGTFLVTVVFNVPLNNRLATVTPESAAGAELWAHYLVRWSAWNHVRTVTSLAAAAGFIVALLRS